MQPVIVSTESQRGRRPGGRLGVALCAGVTAWLVTFGSTPVSRAQSADEQEARVVTDAIEGRARREFFEQKVRPLLAEHCYQCHSRDAEKLRAGLYLDSRAGVLAGGDSGPAMVPGDADSSLLISAVRYESFEMPPGGKLNDEQLEVLQRWVNQGGWWPDEEADANPNAESGFDWKGRKASHWAWQPIQSSSPPQVQNTSWPLNAIDNFILDGLESRGLTPASPADPARLIRRLHFDLIGLPPTGAEVTAFIEDPSPNAYASRVERLLDSPHFGEKWARHWMDLVRYAETCGHEFDYPLEYATQYRDYVIRAFNADVPFDQFVREHVAGDLLPEPRRHPTEDYNESILGTGFWLLGEAVHAPTDVRGDEAARIDNQIDVFGKTFLGLTLACARCHDHKFDPIPTSDYYALAGYLQSSRRQDALLDPHRRIDSAMKRLAELQSQAAALLRASSRSASATIEISASDLLGTASRFAAERTGDGGETQRDLTRNSARWLAALQDPALQSPEHPLYVWWRLAGEAPEGFAAQRDQLAEELDGLQQQAVTHDPTAVVFADFHAANWSDWFVTGTAFGTAPVRPWQVNGATSEPRWALPDTADSGHLSPRLYGVLRSPTFTLDQGQIHYRLKARGVQIRLIVDGYVMDRFSSLLFADNTLQNVDTQGVFQWVSQRRDLEHYLGHRAHLEIIDHGEGFAAVDEIRFSNQGPPPPAPHELGRQLVHDSTIQTIPQLAEAYAKRLRHAVAAMGDTAADRTDVELVNWLLEWRLIEPPEDPWRELQQVIQDHTAAIPAPRIAMAMTDGTGEDERIHIRGNHRNLGPVVPRRMLLAIAGEEQPPIRHGSGRLSLADAVIDSQNPLTARVIVNRLWHQLFGRGLVATVDDFGVMGEAPSHPNLLDWLAEDLRRHQWSLKRSIRQMVMSRTYRMASEAADARAEVLDPANTLWHRARVRRLTAEGIRDAMLAISGRLDPTMYGFSVPVHLTPFMTGRGRPASGPLDGAGRRSIYVRIQRNFLSPMMLAFDMPAPFSTMGRRSISNVPAQSLILMNDEFVWQQAETWARRLLREVPNSDQRLSEAFLAAFGHLPSPAQQEQVRDFVAQQAALYDDSTESLSVWTDVCHALMNAKEFTYLF